MSSKKSKIAELLSDNLACYNFRLRRGDRVVDGAALEKRWAISLVGSNPTLSAITIWRGAGVDDQARLESACRLWRPWVRIPPSPPVYDRWKFISTKDYRYGVLSTIEYQSRHSIEQRSCQRTCAYWCAQGADGSRYYN